MAQNTNSRLPNGTPPSSVGGLKNTLNVVSNFIGTHGLAVFLVVFYALVIYPQSQDERKQWIEQITKVKQLVDPANRPISLTQAEAVLRIVVFGFTERLLFYSRDYRDYYSRGYYEEDYPYYDEDEDDPIPKQRKRFTRAFGESIGLDFNIDIEKQAIDEIDAAYRKFYELMIDAQEESKKGLSKAFEYAKRSNAYAAVQLEKLKLENGSLDKVWEDASSNIKEVWLKEFESTISLQVDHSRKSFIRFIKRHKHYNSWKTKNPEKIKKLKSIEIKDVQDAIMNIQNQLELEVSKQLKPLLE
jgi:hypothetical protein